MRARQAKEEARQQKANKKKKKKHRFNFWKLLRTLLLLLLVVIIIVGIIGYRYLKGIIDETPEINPNNIYELLSENSILYDADGNTMENIYQGGSLRTNIEYKDLPQDLIDAFVSIEDKTFFEHKGFNIVRIFGAIWQRVTGKSERIGGTSTITQQLARNLYLSEIKSSRDMTRKIQEAYYTVIIEKSLSKEQILEAYLNTIYLGYNCDGVAAAAQAYFSKEVKDLNLLECAQLASLPQQPDTYAPLKRVHTSSVTDFDKLDIVSRNDTYTVYYNDAAQSRIRLVLYMMHERGKISDAEWEAAKADNVRNYINPGTNALTTAKTSYFADYVVDQVLEDLMAEYDYTRAEAREMLYKSGLRIYSTMKPEIQAIMEEAYENPENFPEVKSYSKDKAGNILDPNDKILLYTWDNMFNEDGNFVLQPDEFEWLANGDLMVYSGKRLNVYRTSVNGEIDYSVEFKNIYEIEDEVFYSRSGGVWSIPASYKDRDENYNLILSKQFFADKPNAFTRQRDGSLLLSSEYFTLRQRVRQPQSAMVVIDYTNGQIVGMVGGRDLEGKLLYNRATSPRQPGSSIKPLAVYSVALQTGLEEGGTFTAATPIDDVPILYNNSLWPKNWYSGYRGMTTLRNAVEQSINACSVQLFTQLDMNRSIEFLQNMGISSLVTSGDPSDMNASALALGGMTRGISPLEMASAYGTFGNFGVHEEAVSYTKVTNKKGDVILDKIPQETRVMDEPVASLMTDILRTVVTNGLGNRARLQSQPSAGKTGTTSERYDIWFCGLTPQYSAAVWIGNDVNVPLSSDSAAAANLWAKVMDQIGALYEREEFELRGEFVRLSVDRYSGKLPGEFTEQDPRQNAVISELFIKGTEPRADSEDGVDHSHQVVQICADTGYLATPYCTHVTNKYGVVRPGGYSWEKLLATYYETITGVLGENPSRAATNIGSFNLTSLPDAIYDVPDYYCPIHRSAVAAIDPDPNTEPGEDPVLQPDPQPADDTEFDELYPISPFWEQSTFDPTAAVEAGIIDEPVIDEPDPEDPNDPASPNDPSDPEYDPNDHVLPNDQAGWFNPWENQNNPTPNPGIIW